MMPHPSLTYNKMAVTNHPMGYQCEFIDSVPEDFYCKKCTLVARSLTLSCCCGESYCHACIADSCLSCGEKAFSTFEHLKNQQKILSLHVYCSMKERGCDWSGTLEQLDTHLDPDQDNCQYVDTKCPLNCHMTIPKNKVEQHVAQHCAKRPYVCQHCNFKATYEEVVDKHLPECKYVPLQCPNLCGVTFERDFMEDHMKMCRLEKVGCEFSGVGCDGRFIREDQEEHTRQNSQKHLTLTASLAAETKEQLQQKLLEQGKKHKEEEETLRQKIEGQEKKVEEQEMKISELEKKVIDKDKEHNEEEQKLKQKIEELEKTLYKQEKRLDKELNEQKLELVGRTQDSKEIVDRLVEQQKSLQAQLSELSNQLGLNPTFTMTGLSKAKNESSTWRSPAMYTHLYGYKFFFEITANGYGGGRGKAVCVSLWSMCGEYDNQIKWPAKVKIILEVINQHGGDNVVAQKDLVSWHKYGISIRVTYIGNKNYSGCCHLISHSELDNYLVNDTLHFRVSTLVL